MSLSLGPYLFKWADDAAEFEQIHRLNHRTFTQEVPQHAPSPNGLLIDKFHDKSDYGIALREGRVVGMLSCHDRPPFSVACRLADDAPLRRPGMRPLEVRLLAIDPGERRTAAFAGLAWLLYQHALTHGHTHLIMSGVTTRVGMYEALGFASLGPPVGDGDAAFVPMAAPLAALETALHRAIAFYHRRVVSTEAD